jgi:hypothetical protein
MKRIPSILAFPITDATEPLSRARSSAVTSAAVTTTIDRSAPAG